MYIHILISYIDCMAIMTLSSIAQESFYLLPSTYQFERKEYEKRQKEKEGVFLKSRHLVSYKLPVLSVSHY